MANKTVKLYAQSFGYIYGGEPYETHPVSGNSFWNVEAGRGNVLRALFVQFQPMPDALRRKKLVSISVTFRARCTLSSDLYAGGTVKIKRLADVGTTFDPSTITYANAPDIETSPLLQTVISGGTTPVVREYTDYLFQESATLGADFFARNRTLVFTSDYSNSVNALEISTRLADGTTPLYVTVTYDDAVDVEPQMWLFEPAHKIDPVYGGTADTISFRFGGQLSAISADNEWTVRSIELFYRRWGTQNYTQVHADAEDLLRRPLVEDYWNYLVPPYMLDAGSRYEWYVIITDTEGNVWRPNEVGTAGDGEGTRQDDTATFWTNDLVLLWIDYPTGKTPSGRLNNAVPHTIRWKLRTEGYDVDVIQDSARLFWREDGETAYHAILFSGPDKTVSLPAYSFPAGKTITYYLSATGCGYTAQTATATFETYAYSLQLYEYPQGNKVCPGDVLDFTYTLQTTTGTDVDVVSSTLYWRESTAGSYAAITDTSGEKAVHVPANTIPTGISVQWYLEATSPDGTVKTSTPRSFSTASSQITPQASPTDGYTDPRDPITFSWYLAAGDGSVAQASASLFWKLSTSGSYTEVQAGTANSVTIPANTFPVAGTIEWYLAGTDYNGQTSQTQVFSFSTTASTAFATCVSPVGRVEDGTKQITFRWDVANEDGTEPSRVALYWKLDTETESQWKTLLDTTEAVYSYTAPERTFSAGAIDWKVAAWNRDSVKGPENQASFVCLMAPDAPAGLRATAVPRTTVSWQSSGQEAYEIRIDGIVEAKEYGPAVSSWQREEPLPDGVHTIEVRIQGQYGLWSTPAVTSIDVVNVPATTITLTGAFDVDAMLSWVYGDTVTDPEPNVYRDGKRIAALKDVLQFADRFALGEHSYYVTLWDDSGYYSISNIVTGTMESDVPRICAADGGEWLALRLTDASDGAEDFQWSQTYAVHNIRGASFPVLEVGSHESLTGSYSCAFSSQQEAEKLEAMRGKRVIMKTRRGNVITGALLQLQKQVRLFYTVYSFSLQQLHWEDFIRDENR